MFVTVEGIEASGKSTLVSALAARLEEAGLDVAVTREPGGTELGDRVRALFLDPLPAIGPLAETFLVNASRAQLVAEVIRLALQSGRTVLCDRYADATLAYQGFGRGLEVGELKALCDAATGGLWPDRTLLVDVPVELAFERLGLRANKRDRLEREGGEFHERVRAGYLALARDDPRFVVLDGTLPPQRVLELAWNALAVLRATGR